MTNETKKELAAFLRDYAAMCFSGPCQECQMHGYSCCPGVPSFDTDRAIAAIEAWRERRKRKPKPEVIDKAVDIYTFEVEVERKGFECELRNAKKCAKHAAKALKDFYNNYNATVSVLSAKRFARKTHREE